MGAVVTQLFSEKQKEALRLLHSDATNVMLFGGRRSGKTYAILSDIVAAAYQYPGLQALIARSALSHAKASIWNQTLNDVLKGYPSNTYRKHPGDLVLVVKTNPESRIVFGGFDDKERIEKQLGQEFAIIYANECSTISYDAILLSQSSLAQNIPGFKNKFYYDMNPPAPTHWTYRLFISKIDPKSDEEVKRPDNYKSLLMNPMDNPYLDPEYLQTLDDLPDRERRRYKFGEFVKVEGAIYDVLDVNKHVIDIEDLPPMQYYTVGIDNSGTNFASILIGYSGDNIYVLDEYHAYRETMQNFDATIQYKWRQYNYTAYPDPAAAQLNDLIWNVAKTDNAVEPGINYILDKIHNNQFFLLKINNRINTPELLSQMDSYRRDDKGRIVKELDHACFTEDTKVIVRNGIKNIKDVMIGDEVLTPNGYREVLDSGQTGIREVMTYTQGNKTLFGTPDHPIYQNGIKIPLSKAYLSTSDTTEDLCKSNTCLQRVKKEQLLYGMARDIINQIKDFTIDSNSQIKLDTYIEMFGNTITGLFPQGTSFITRTKIKTIIILTTLNVLLIHNIANVMKIFTRIKSSVKSVLGKLLSGIGQKKEELHIEEQQESIGQNGLKELVKYVAKSLCRKTKDPKQLLEHATIPVLEHLETAIEKSKIPVYNITVKDEHKYYANGFLVSNCDALRYGIYSHARYGASILIGGK